MKHPKSGVPVFRPGFGEEELVALREVFESGWLGPGPKAVEFECAFADFVGARFAVSVTSGTAALHLSCLAAGLGPGDQVLVPSLTFASTAHAPLYCGADVVFVEVDAETFTMDPSDLRAKVTPRARAVIPVHYGGHPCRMEEIWDLARRHQLLVIEDAAHACGAKYGGRRVGGLDGTDVTCFSFNALKNLSTGDGGMVTTNSPQVAERVRKLRWMGIEKSTFERSLSSKGPDGSSSQRTSEYEWFYEVQDLGYKYIMNDIVAAIGLVQLGKLERNQKIRRAMAARYSQAFSSLTWLQAPKEQAFAESAWHLYAVRTAFRETLKAHLREEGIATSVHYHPLHLQTFYRERSCVSLPLSEQLAGELLTLPFHPNLRDDEIDRVIRSVSDFSKRAVALGA